MPRLPEGAMIFENELADEAIEIRPDQIAHEADDPGIFDELFEDWIAMQPENLADAVLGVARERVGFLFRQHEHIRRAFPRCVQPANLDHSRMNRAAVFDRREVADDEETLIIPLALAFRRKHLRAEPGD